MLRESDHYGSTASFAIMPLKIALSLFGYVIHPLFSGRYSERPLDSSAFGADRPRQEHRRQSQCPQTATSSDSRSGRYCLLLRIGHRAGLCQYNLRLLRTLHRRRRDDDYALYRHDG